MKKELLLSVFNGVLLWLAPETNYLRAQELTVPDYSLGR